MVRDDAEIIGALSVFLVIIEAALAAIGLFGESWTPFLVINATLFFLFALIGAVVLGMSWGGKLYDRYKS